MRHILTFAAFVGFTSLAVAGAPPLPSNENDITVQNGIDIIYLSNGGLFPTTGPVFPAMGDPAIHEWSHQAIHGRKVLVPDTAAVLGTPGSHGSTMEITGHHFFIFYLDPTTGGDIGDFYVSKGVMNAGGAIEPDIAGWPAPVGGIVYIQYGNAGLPAFACPPAGFIGGYELVATLTDPITGLGFTVTGLDGTTHISQIGFAVGGQVLTGGSCAAGNVSTTFAYSTDETSVTPTLGGGAEEGGFNAVLATGPLGYTEDALSSSYAADLSYRESTLSMRVNESKLVRRISGSSGRLFTGSFT
jgi:hypothetical protein